MITNQFRNALELGEFLRQNFQGPFFSYGVANELVMRDQATNRSTLAEEDFIPISAIKPRFFFRGQNKAYDWLLPNLFRDYAPLNKFSLNEKLVLRHRDASHEYTMPNPYFRPALAARYLLDSL